MVTSEGDTTMTTITLDVESVRFTAEHDPDPDLSWLEQDCFNEPTADEPAGWGLRRIDAYNRGDWHMLGVRAVLVLKGGTEIASPGLWSIESDSEPAYLVDVGREELHEVCHAHGIDPDALLWMAPDKVDFI
jgi:hypothetical protein